MNTFARSNLAVALLRLREAQEKARCTALEEPENRFLVGMCGSIEWSVGEAIRQIENACALEDVASADTLPAAPESEARRIGR